MSLRMEQSAFAKDTVKLYVFIENNGAEFTYGEAQRTIDQQEIYVKSGKSKTMKSYHLQKLAVDLNIFKDGIWFQKKDELQVYGDFWESLNPLNQWGGNWSFYDAPHFQRTA